MVDLCLLLVALFTRAWIEILILTVNFFSASVALFTRAWIEISFIMRSLFVVSRRPLYEGVD